MTQEEILMLMKSDTNKGMHIVTNQFAALVYKTVWGKLNSVCSAEDIEEVVSDVFLEFYKKHGTVDLSKGSLSTFFITLAQRKAVDIFRKQLRQQNIAKVLSGQNEDITFYTENSVLKSEERELILNCILKLGEPDSTIIYRKFYYGETYQEIGNKLGLSENAVNKRYLNAIDKLHLMMKGDFFND